MVTRIALQTMLFFSPTFTFLLSLILMGPARGQTILITGAAPARVAASAPAGRFLIVYRDGQIPSSALGRLNGLGARLAQRHDVLAMDVVEAVSPAAREKLASDPAIAFIVPDLVLNAHTIRSRPFPKMTSAPDALYHSPQGWAVQQVGGFGADANGFAAAGPWNTSKGNGIRIAILDSGVDPNHPDIAPNLALNLSEVNHAALASVCDDGTPLDQQGHGTWTASLAAGALGANTGLVAGVAPEASILNIKVLERMPASPTAGDPTGCIEGQASGLLSWFLQGLEDAISNRADIISMSFGTLVDISTGDGAGDQAIFNRATQAAYNAGIVLIAAAGNDGVNLNDQRLVELPAQSRDVLAIVAATNPLCAEDLKLGATCKAGPVSVPYYSNFGAPLNALAAPGGSYPSGGALNPSTTAATESGWVTGACSSGKPSTISGVPEDSAHSLGCFALGHTAYVQAMGTSASAPLVAGAAALILGAHPTWKPAAVVRALRLSASSTPSLSVPQVSVAKLLTPVTR
jgi:subtilisin family serine protease